MVEAPHRPRYRYCTDPEICCHTYDPLSIRCDVDGEEWPCATKRSHCTPAKAARLQRWADSRIGRAPLPLWEQLLANRADVIGRLIDDRLTFDGVASLAVDAERSARALTPPVICSCSAPHMTGGACPMHEHTPALSARLRGAT